MHNKPFRGAALNRSHPLVRGLVGLWLFNEGAGSLLFDHTRNGNNGTISQATWDGGRRGHALSFDGVNDYVVGPYWQLLFSVSICTISVWLYPTDNSGTGTYSYELPSAISDTNDDFWISNGAVGGSDRIWVATWGPGGPAENIHDIGITYSVNQWIHVVMVHENGTLYAYKNGALVGSTAAGNIYNANNPINFGRTLYGDKYFKGLIEDVRIYSRGLSAGEVKDLCMNPYAIFEEPGRGKYFGAVLGGDELKRYSYIM